MNAYRWAGSNGRRMVIPCCVAIAMAFCGCSARVDSENALRAARASLAQRDHASAVVHLKNVLQLGENREAHELLALSQYELGQFLAAETHARRALAAGVQPDRLMPVLARSMNATGNARRLVDEFARTELGEPAPRAEFQAALAEAMLALGRLDDAAVMANAAERSDPASIAARVARAKVMFARGHTADAEALVDQLLAAAPRSAAAIALKADLHVARQKHAESKRLYANVVALEPRNAQARFALVMLHMATGDLDAARRDIAAMRQKLPGDVRAGYLEAVLAFREQQPVKAQESIQQVLRVVPDHAPSMLLAGATAYSLGTYATAENYLRRVLQAFPHSLYARQLLVATYLRKGQPSKAEDALAPALKAAPHDAQVLRSAGEVAFANHRIAEAAGYYERALAVDKGSPAAAAATRTRLAQIRLVAGETDRAIEDLEAASGLDRTQVQSDLSLIATHLNRREHAKALVAVAELEKKQPGNPLVHAVRASVLLAKQEGAAARKSLEQALAIQPTFLPAVRILANLDLSEGRPDRARGRFQDLIARDPANDAAHLALAEFLTDALGNPREIAAAIDRAIKLNPGSVTARVAKVKFHTRNKDPRAALAAARAAVEAAPGDLRAGDALGLAQLAAGETEKAIETYMKLTTEHAEHPLPWMRLASAQYAARQIDAPIAALRRALALRPDLLQAQRDIIAVHLASGRLDEALKESRQIQSARPHEAIGYALEGEVLASQRKYAEAAQAYGEGLKRQPEAELAVKQHQLLIAAGRQADAERLAAKWLRDNPRDGVFRFYVANSAAQGNDLRSAADRYKELLAHHPDNIAVLNNLAWVLGEARHPDAIGYAERAYRQAPTMPEVLDTYGWLLVQSGAAGRGVELLRQAAAAAPSSPDIRLRYAKALLATGDKAAARRELDEAAKDAVGATKAEIDRLRGSP